MCNYNTYIFYFVYFYLYHVFYFRFIHLHAKPSCYYSREIPISVHFWIGWWIDVIQAHRKQPMGVFSHQRQFSAPGRHELKVEKIFHTKTFIRSSSRKRYDIYTQRVRATRHIFLDRVTDISRKQNNKQYDNREYVYEFFFVQGVSLRPLHERHQRNLDEYRMSSRTGPRCGASASSIIGSTLLRKCRPASSYGTRNW